MMQLEVRLRGKDLSMAVAKQEFCCLLCGAEEDFCFLGILELLFFIGFAIHWKSQFALPI